MLTTVRKLLDLFEARERWQLAGLFACILLMAFLQAVGVASIMPFMSLVADPGIVHQNPLLARAYALLGFVDVESFIFFVGVMVLGLMALGNGFSALVTWWMLRFVWTKHHDLSVRLLTRYLHEPYTFFLDRNSSSLGKNILAEVKEVINGILVPGLKVLAQMVVALFILALLLLVDVKLALSVAVVLGCAYGGVYVTVRIKQGKMGRQRVQANGRRFTAVVEALSGIKDVKVLGCEREFIHRFARPSRLYSQVTAKNAVISEVPRFALETLAFGGILVIVLYLLATHGDLGRVLSTVTLYALAGYRLMPALQQIFTGLTKARFFLASLDSLHADLMRPAAPERAEQPEPERLTFEREIRIERLSYRYPTSDLPVLREISLRIPRNTTVAFVGSTGSGKTTLADIILGLLEPQEGAVLIDGVELRAANLRAWRRMVGYVPQHIFLADDTVLRNIAFGVPEREIDAAAVERAARLANLDDFVAGLPAGYATAVGDRGIRLSGGQRQRIGIARALYHDPAVLIMDEATSALDGVTESAVMEAINRVSGQKTIVLIAHRLTTVRDADAIFLFRRGRIVSVGTYQELHSTSEEFRLMAEGRSATAGAA